MQSNQELIKFAIFGEFFENGEGPLVISSYFFHTQNDLEKIIHQYHDDLYLKENKLEFLEHF